MAQSAKWYCLGIGCFALLSFLAQYKSQRKKLEYIYSSMALLGIVLGGVLVNQGHLALIFSYWLYLVLIIAATIQNPSKKMRSAIFKIPFVIILLSYKFFADYSLLFFLAPLPLSFIWLYQRNRDHRLLFRYNIFLVLLTVIAIIALELNTWLGGLIFGFALMYFYQSISFSMACIYTEEKLNGSLI